MQYLSFGEQVSAAGLTKKDLLREGKRMIRQLAVQTGTSLKVPQATIQQYGLRSVYERLIELLARQFPDSRAIAPLPPPEEAPEATPRRRKHSVPQDEYQATLSAEAFQQRLFITSALQVLLSEGTYDLRAPPSCLSTNEALPRNLLGSLNEDESGPTLGRSLGPRGFSHYRTSPQLFICLRSCRSHGHLRGRKGQLDMRWRLSARKQAGCGFGGTSCLSSILWQLTAMISRRDLSWYDHCSVHTLMAHLCDSPVRAVMSFPSFPCSTPCSWLSPSLHAA